jgi:hypothetical protein
MRNPETESPSWTFPRELPLSDFGYVLSKLGLDVVERIPADAPDARERLPAVLEWILRYSDELEPLFARRPSEFAEYVANEVSIPIEQSPLEGRTLADILARGAAGGLVYGIGPGGPLGVIEAAGAIIVLANAVVIADWSTSWLRDLLPWPK